MTPSKTTIIARNHDLCPDRFWYQLNGKSAQENFCDQLKTRNQGYDDTCEIIIESKVKTR